MAYIGNSPVQDETVSSAQIIDGAIVNADVNSSAAIAISKTALVAGTGITLSTNTLNLDAAQTGITSLLATDIKFGEDDQTKIDFETADEIHFYAANVEQVYLGDNIFGPQSDSDVDLGATGVRWKDAFVDSITVTGEVDAVTLDISGNADIDGTTNLDAVDIDGAVDMASTLAVGGDVTITSATSAKPELTIKNTNADASAPELVFIKDSSSPADDDEAGRIYMFADDDGGNQAEAFLAIGKLTDVSNGSEDSNFDMYTLAGGTQKATLSLSSGSVGIGTATPKETFEVKGDIANWRLYSRTGVVNGALAFNSYYNDADSAWAHDDNTKVSMNMYLSDSRNNLEFSVRAGDAGAGAGSTQMVISSAGRVGIGTESPSTGLHLSGGDNTASKLTLTNTAPSPDNTWTLHPEYNSQNLTLSEDSTARVTFESGGNVGIGCTNPANKMNIQVATDHRIGFWGDTNYSAIQSTNDANNAYKKLRFDASEYHIMNGNVGIGGTPSTILHLQGHDPHFRIEDTSGTTEYWNISVGQAQDGRLQIDDSDNDNGVYMNQNDTSWTSGSDERLKTNWTAFDDALGSINSLTKVGTFQYTKSIEDQTPKNDAVHSGLSAQEVQKFLPNSVSENSDGILGLQYQHLIPVLVKAVQELSAEVEKLKGN